MRNQMHRRSFLKGAAALVGAAVVGVGMRFAVREGGKTIGAGVVTSVR